jgi:serine/threonine-protein kinase
MVYVPAGEFVMGLDDPEELSRSHALDLRPPQMVYLDAFWIDRTEVTNGMYELCVEAGACEPPFKPPFTTRVEYYGNPAYADYPVVGVRWEGANVYCAWAGRRLPTEAEWEKAARGTDRRIYPWGDEAPRCTLVNYLPCYGDTMAVGSLPAGASPYGALDMAGNAWEWVADWYEPEAYPTPFPVKGQEPVTETLHVVRGGSWGDMETVLQSGVRFAGWPIDELSIGFGFRCMRDAAP